GDRAREGRVGVTVQTAGVAGGDGQGRRRDGEGALVVGDRVVRQRRPRQRGRDGVAAHVADRRGRRAVRGGDRVPVHQAADGTRKGRVGVPVEARLVAGRDHQPGRGDRQGAVDEAEDVVRRGQAALGRGDGVGAYPAGGRGSGRQAGAAREHAGRVPVDEA